MPLPSRENIQLPLLKVLADAGGILTAREATERVKKYYPKPGQKIWLAGSIPAVIGSTIE